MTNPDWQPLYILDLFGTLVTGGLAVAKMREEFQGVASGGAFAVHRNTGFWLQA